jgi:hypothetical protein
MKTINFHIVEDRERGYSEVYMLNEYIDMDGLSLDKILSEDDSFDVSHVLSIVTKDYYLENRFDYLEQEVDHYVISKKVFEPSDYYDVIQKFLSELCDFYEQKYTIYLKVSLT